MYAARSGDAALALKVIQSEGPVTDADRARFLTEADRMKRVVHPSIVPLVGVGFLPDGRPWIAMPRLEGAPLADRTAQPIAASRALPLFRGVAHGVAALHAAGLVHRDIKPQNIFWVDPDERLILLDLGIAREIDASPSTTTRAGFSRGTPAYMAPERLFGHIASVRSDLYELALVLVVMLLGRLPWEEGDPQGRMLPQLANTVIPPELVPLLSRALSLDVERRPASVGELLEQLATAHVAARGENLLATAPTELVPTPRLAERANTPSSAPALATLTSTPMPRAVLAASMATLPTRPRPSPAWPLAVTGAGVFALAVGVFVFVRSGSPSAQPSTQTHGPVPAESPSTSDGHSATAPSEPAPTALAPSDSAEGAPSSNMVPSGKPSSTAVAPSSSTSVATVTAAPSTSGPAPSTSSSAAAPSTPAACGRYVALMCDPKSGATALECSSAKSNVARWTAKLPASAAVETCQAALDASKIGLAGRRDWKPP